jgi:hypothetical protein
MSSPLQPIVIGSLPTGTGYGAPGNVGGLAVYTPSPYDSPATIAKYFGTQTSSATPTDEFNTFLGISPSNANPGVVNSPALSLPSSATTPSSSSGFGSIFSGLLGIGSGNVAGGMAQMATGAGNVATGTSASNLFGLTWGRVGGFVLGLILIAAGLYLFGRQELAPVVNRGLKFARA